MKGLMSEEEIQSSRFAEACKLRVVEQELISGDTLVFVDFPDVSRRRSKQTDCYGISYSSQKLRVHSEKLLATGSAKFAEMLSPTYQFRIKRRKKLTKDLPEGVKYVLDLTPQSEGDELVSQMTQLSLTPGIIRWWAASGLHKVSNWLVSGHDDVCTCGRQHIPGWGAPRQDGRGQVQGQGQEESAPNDNKPPGSNINDVVVTAPTPDDLISKKEHGINQPYDIPDYRNIPDYCPIRHRNSIIRLLMMIEGQDIMLDSANRVWTLVAVAKIFDCTSVIRDRVAQWLMFSANTKFIEVLPEEALQLGFDLELVQVTQCAFRILVNELALKEAASQPHRGDSSSDPNWVTVFGRRLGNLDDELHNIVQHAARAFVERVSAIPGKFRGFHHFKVEEYAKLREMEEVLAQQSDEASVKASKSMSVLMAAMRRSISNAYSRLWVGTNTEQEALASMDEDRATYVLPEDFRRLEEIIPTLNLNQKFLLPFAYQHMSEWWHNDPTQSKWLAMANQLSPNSIKANMIAAMDDIQQAITANPERASQPQWAIFLDPTEGPLRVKNPLIDLEALNRQMHDATLRYGSSWLRFDIEPALNITRHLLLTLENNELKYLPLWAGGCNDGTGGVFQEELPPADWGPSGPGPAYHTGITIPSTSSTSGSLVDGFSAFNVRGSTVVGSVDVQDGTSTVYAPDHVIPDDTSIASESFEVDGPESYQEARFAVPAEHQDMGHAVDMMVESLDSDSDTASVTTDRVMIMGSALESGAEEFDEDGDVMSLDD
ncbi:hypothetical protein BBK36DRAFT_1107705 [Trichoderma citrinoviride]|uniref:BTB domain-containing protein n=1 Tax=Trichoderma citrinoviride TaxID=58853 RepID=A0A2T4BN98_9HYPO|nr:hypothetical protein BBK36DRAFT_1107705 [Trichoderma citrinoviride]PTB70793.1 hypothetical protein BBK36DRAFT_1107705 [Trichoderma citrinoviride]